jgi:hypothetical protein
MFKLGDEIVEACKLEPPSYENLQTRIERKRRNNGGTNGRSRKRPRRHVTEDDDVEPSDDSMTTNEQEVEETEMDVNTYQSIRRQVQNEEYRKKKAMSTAIFQYFMNATPAQQLAMQVEIDPELQTVWKNPTGRVNKQDDLGDALLHSLDAAICQSSKYRQLIPSSPTLNKNRTVVVVLLPDKAFWVVLECLWNRFTLQDMGVYATNLTNQTFSGQETIEGIVARLDPRLLRAMSEFDTSLDCLSDTGYIKIIVKQLKSYGRTDMSPKAAGALTNSTVKAFTNICDAACPNSTLSVSHSKKSGWLYSRTCKESGKRIDVLRSSGKHLNAILSCLQWMKCNLPNFVRDRPLRIDGSGRCKFFQALKDVALNFQRSSEDDDQVAKLECIHLNERVIEKLKFNEGRSSDATKKTLADLILIALGQNQQYISAVSTNYRKTSGNRKTSRQRHAKSPSETQDRTDGSITADYSSMQICTCGTSIPCQSNRHLKVNIRST